MRQNENRGESKSPPEINWNLEIPAEIREIPTTRGRVEPTIIVTVTWVSLYHRSEYTLYTPDMTRHSFTTHWSIASQLSRHRRSACPSASRCTSLCTHLFTNCNCRRRIFSLLRTCGQHRCDEHYRVWAGKRSLFTQHSHDIWLCQYFIIILPFPFDNHLAQAMTMQTFWNAIAVARGKSKCAKLPFRLHKLT